MTETTFNLTEHEDDALAALIAARAMPKRLDRIEAALVKSATHPDSLDREVVGEALEQLRELQERIERRLGAAV